MAGFIRQVKLFPKTFWAANTLELFERWAYYGIFNLLALYLTNSPESGALGFTQVEKGMIMGTVNFILYFLPVITGAIADKFGYRKVLIIAFIVLVSGYYLMGIVKSYSSVFITFFYVAIGAALFKPIISATIAKTTTDENSSLGFGIFYMMINVGGMLGPFLASELREVSWNYIFIMSSASIALNLLITIFIFREPDRQRNTDPLLKSFRIIFTNIIRVVMDFKFSLFLLIIIFSWTVYWQFFFSLPVFIEQWTDTSIMYDALYSKVPGFARAVGTSEGIILAEKIITLDAVFIVIFQVIVSTLISRFKALNSMTTGIFINTLGLTLAVMTMNPFFLVLSILIFSFGEMTFSPKILEYIGKIAPRDKAALYMGTQFLPISIGNFLGGFISGRVYEKLADKVTMMKDLLPAGTYTGLTEEEITRAAMEVSGLDHEGLRLFLWETNHPWMFGFVLAGMGIFSTVSLILYNRAFFRD